MYGVAQTGLTRTMFITVFITVPEFLPRRPRHREQVVQTLLAAEARERTRLAELRQHVLANLDGIITAAEPATA